ncbi:uncharacterized protein P174DRAFT_436128 [Aspergillus novofumigatus IBT 16806]|uniref:Uncharacterized protein n=1 Tax=Aspergillus novofumigatus (strain IBT 16806) TaxID=1392255 RepID=A0A2I1BT92_ASPN1|nr:uncharacterized protein P174DRAFT_436128 [Aspergillus novofumigatus IBT 16806]PKX88623.1 hypothetical protein P174DRAFT_436128 [Aspergillus novofumigatus IBT 16806]
MAMNGGTEEVWSLWDAPSPEEDEDEIMMAKNFLADRSKAKQIAEDTEALGGSVEFTQQQKDVDATSASGSESSTRSLMFAPRRGSPLIERFCGYYPLPSASVMNVEEVVLGESNAAADIGKRPAAWGILFSQNEMDHKRIKPEQDTVVAKRTGNFVVAGKDLFYTSGD